jgi:hypothetical protein
MSMCMSLGKNMYLYRKLKGIFLLHTNFGFFGNFYFNRWNFEVRIDAQARNEYTLW